MAKQPRRTPPNDIAAEESLLGALMLSSSVFEDVSRVVAPQDFYKPSNRVIYGCMLELWKTGKPIDVVSVVDEVRSRGFLERIGGASTLTSMMVETPSIASANRYAEIIVKMATYRRAIGVAKELVDLAYDMDGDPNDIIDQAKVELDIIGVRLGDIPSGVWQLDEFLSRPDTERAKWLIPGIIREGWRVMIVASEGHGKTVLLRQLAITAAQGIHCFHFGQIEPCRTLIVDLENPDDSILDTCIPINERAKLKVSANYDPDRAWLWHREAGINLRQRADRIALETIIDNVRPQLVCLGPIYKAYEVQARENDEMAARDVMKVFDDLRTRYKFGLVLEHHAPKESAGTKRKLMPYGSSLWLRWPEIGVNMYPKTEGSLDRMVLGRWRGDRLDNEWPEELTRGSTWPWSGVWPTGYLAEQNRNAGVQRDIPIMEPLDDLLPLELNTPDDEGPLPPLEDYDRF